MRHRLRIIVFAALLGSLDQTLSLAQDLDSQLKPVVDKIVAGCASAGAKRVTVADFTDLQGQVTELGRFLAEEFSASLVDASRLGVVDRANLRTILAEHKLNVSGLVNPDTAKKLGQVAGVDGIVMGTITPIGDTVRITVKVVGTETATLMATGRADLARTKAIDELLGRGVQTGATGTASGATPPPSSASSSKAQYETTWFSASVKRLVVQSNGNVIVFMEYRGKRPEDLRVGLSGCSTDWRYKTYLVDDVGNMFPVQSASGIGYVGCDFINDPVSLTSETPATFSIIFERPRQLERQGARYSLSSAQRVGRIGVDGRWRSVSEVNVGIMDIQPAR